MATEPGFAWDVSDDLADEIAGLRATIDRESTATDVELNAHPSAVEPGYPRWGHAEHQELARQLAALRGSVARAVLESRDERMLRAELATLLPFARTLATDAAAWRAQLEDGLRQVARRDAAARAERERAAAERDALMRHRDALQSGIDRAAGRMERDNRADCRRTIPVFALGEGATVCSISVRIPRRGLRTEKRWLVTLNDSRDEVVIKRG